MNINNINSESIQNKILRNLIGEFGFREQIMFYRMENLIFVGYIIYTVIAS